MEIWKEGLFITIKEKNVKTDGSSDLLNFFYTLPIGPHTAYTVYFFTFVE